MHTQPDGEISSGPGVEGAKRPGVDAEMRERPRADAKGLVFDIQRFSVHDGPGIRTTVFLKGCPLRCLWCHNPESQRMRPEISFEHELCISCGNCVEACPESALVIAGGRRLLRRELCAGCGRCVETCYTNALVLKGKRMTAGEVLEEALRDMTLYQKSGGGITLSGGEPAAQPVFALSILQGARERGLHTAIETCGFAPREVMERLLGVTDLIIYDIKHADSGMHERLTGQGNELILANLERIAVLRATGAAGDGGVLIRLPLIPGYNDDNENLEKTAAILQNFGIAAVEIIPYHDFASDKYKLLDAAYQLRELKAYTREQLNSKVALLQDHGLDPRIGV